MIERVRLDSLVISCKKGKCLNFFPAPVLEEIFLGAFSRSGFSTICVRGGHFTSKLQGRFDFACTLTSKSSRICLGQLSLSLGNRLDTFSVPWSAFPPTQKLVALQ